MTEDEKKFRRNYRACLNCRVRKVKCDLGPVDSPRDGKCARCLRERKDCVFVDSKRGRKSEPEPKRFCSESPRYDDRDYEYTGYQGEGEKDEYEKEYEKEDKEYEKEYEKGDYQKDYSNYPKKLGDDFDQFSSVEGALVFLAKAAGKIAQDDARDHIDARERHDSLGPVAGELEPVPGRKQMPADLVYPVRPRGTTKLSSIDYIGGRDGILSEQEAEMLINYFFSTMHPFFPHIPSFLHSPKVLAGYPILLCAILTIASRYHQLSDSGSGRSGVPRNIEVHDRLWLYVQRLISQTVWAEASTRSIGTIFAFLLFTEWNPRAIHWRWSDYANRAEEKVETDKGADNLAGLGASRRSYRMAWMLIGSAVRLAQDMGFMEMSSKTFLATHIAEINSVMNISRRSMLAHSLSDVDLDGEDAHEDEAREAEADARIMAMGEDELKAHAARHVLRFTPIQKAQIELLQIMSLGHESLYGYKAQLGHLSARQNLAVLGIISPLINNWGRKFRSLLVPLPQKLLRANVTQHWGSPRSRVVREVADAVARESLIFEYNYAKLYVYSLALSPSRGSEPRKRTLKLDEIRRSATYIEQAFNAANDMLSVAHRVHKIKILRFMPVRWMARIVRAVAFIVKCYLTITAHKSSGEESIDDFDPTVLSLSLISVDDIVQSIQRAAITLRDCSPDELHLCTRYSNVLLYLCSEMKTKLRGERDWEPLGEPKEVMADSEVMDWFASNRDVGLDFVGPWTEMIEQQLNMSEL